MNKSNKESMDFFNETYFKKEHERMNKPVYCSFCGQQLIDSIQDKYGNSVNPELEKLRKAHTSCYNKYNSTPKKEIDWDSYIKQNMRGRE